jgi:hypothetical protein
MKKHVTFEQAKLLKEKGFNYKVTKFKDLVTNTEIDNAPLGNYNLTSQSVSIPEQHEVVDWLWETYLIDVSTIPIREKGYSFMEVDKMIQETKNFIDNHEKNLFESLKRQKEKYNIK